MAKKILLFVVNVDWFFTSHRMPIALAAMRDGYEVHIATSITTKLDDLRRNGLIVHELKLRREGASFLNGFSSLRQLVRLFRLLRPRVVHLVTIKPVLLGGIAARLTGIPAVVAAVSGLGYVFTAQGKAAYLRRWAIAKVYRIALSNPRLQVIFQNEDDRRILCHFARLDPARSILIRGSGVDLRDYHLSPLPPGVPTVVMAARLLRDKGVGEFIEAARLLRGRGSIARFVLVGSLDEANPTSLTKARLEAIVKEDIVELWGHRTDMPNVMAQASIVVLPSYREGLPKVLIEAAACGRPVVTTDVPGCRDAIEADMTGLLVPVRDAVALAYAIERLVSSPALCRDMGVAGRRLAEAAFDLKIVVDAHLNLYKKIAMTS
ncbi:glycosyltransferase family 4 protein [Variovorax guangxiensis]|uniref:Glycosyltransferase family 1 protein n=1 Tax=Variovorax guangxiensis TaxID=1775474 RepID=A0A502DKE1_9BURK|nr:glycosyltransferase family 4 protein [Variovorax guangxiensis]TPG20635.1 glycosyltransferase family 1 protein [Variovorax ginsengisoli]TPG25778.1 glycosyltransferase family 1 protein [Variovorax guangxiensis]